MDTETTAIIWRATGVYEFGFRETGAVITLSVTRSPAMMPSGRWTVTLSYNYVGERENTFTTWSRREAAEMFAEWVKKCRAIAVEEQIG